MFSSEIKSVRFTGIGGTAMASAAAMKDKGFAVTGSDQNVYPPMSTFLVGKQIEAMDGYGTERMRQKLFVVGSGVLVNTTMHHGPAGLLACGTQLGGAKLNVGCNA